jgi:hypothetical protein
MKTGRRWAAALLTAPLLLSVPASALHQSFGAKAAEKRVTIKQSGTSATQVILHQNEERGTFVSFAAALRAQFRGVRGSQGNLLRASTNRYLRDLLADLRLHWRAERRTGVVSPFDFPDL